MLTVAEVAKRLCDALPDAERWLCVLAHHIGWRWGRLVTLTWDQVDFEAGVIHAPKSQRKQKTVGTAPIYGDMQEVLLESWRDNQAAPVIHRPHGGPVVWIRKQWVRATKAAGCEGLRFHDLRACAASNLADAGIPEADIMKIGGWKTRAVFDRYRIVSNQRLREIGKAMESHRKEKKGVDLLPRAVV